MRHFLSMRFSTVGLVLGIALAFGAGPDAVGQRFQFDRSFDTAPGTVVDISTLGGAIEVSARPGDRVAVRGTAKVRIGFNVPVNAVELARGVAANPPVQQ